MIKGQNLNHNVISEEKGIVETSSHGYCWPQAFLGAHTHAHTHHLHAQSHL